MREAELFDTQKYLLVLHSNNLCLELVDAMFDPQKPYYQDDKEYEKALLGMVSKFLYHISCTTQIRRAEYDEFIKEKIKDLGLQPNCKLERVANTLRCAIEGKAEILGSDSFKGLSQLGELPTSVTIKRFLGPLFDKLSTAFLEQRLSDDMLVDYKKHAQTEITNVFQPDNYLFTK